MSKSCAKLTPLSDRIQMFFGPNVFLFLLFASALLAYEGGTFPDNQFRFVVEHLPQLLESDTGKILLIGAGGVTREKLAEQYLSMQFEELIVWNKNSWDKTAAKRNWYGIFDCVVALNILEREQNRDKVMQFVYNLLKHGGKVLMYVDPKEKETFDQRIEHYVLNSKWKECVPIIPSLSIPEYQKIIESAGFHILSQSPSEYKIYYTSPFCAFLSLCEFVCSRWPVPRTDWDIEQFAGEIRGRLNHQYEVIEETNACPIFNSWIEDVLPTYFFIFKK